MWNRLRATLAPTQPNTGNKAQAPVKSETQWQPLPALSAALAHAANNQFALCLPLLRPLRDLLVANERDTTTQEGQQQQQQQQQQLSERERVEVGVQLDSLNQVVRRKLDDLLRADDHLAVCHACRILSFLQELHPSMSTENEGLDTYLDFLEKLIHKDATEFMKLLVEESDTTASASVLADLFSLTGSIIHDALPLVSQFSSDGVHKLVSSAHRQCSLHVTNIFELFSEELNLADTVQQIQSYRNVPSESVSPLISNPLQLDETLQTISLMCAYATRYVAFIHGKDATVDCGNLQANVQVMLGNYLALESFYLEHALQEAIASQQSIIITKANQEIARIAAAAAANALAGNPNHNNNNYNYNNYYSQPNGLAGQKRAGSPGPAAAATATTATATATGTSSNELVDDSFFVLKKCLKRALATLAANVACAIVNSAHMSLEDIFFSNISAICAQLAPQPTDVFLEVLNDLELTSEYVGKLHQELTTDVTRLFTVAAEKAKLQACFDDMMKSASNTCNKLRKKNLSLYGDKLNSKIDIMFTALFRTVNYELDENTYEQAEINDPFVLRLLQDLQDLLKPAKTTLRPLNKSDLALSVAAFISTKLEAAVLAKRFTLLGAVQLSKEVRQLGDYFVTLGGQPLRYQFTKLAQISQLLNLDRVIDCMEYWIEGKSVFKLGADEVRQVLSRRIDFTAETINALKL